MTQLRLLGDDLRKHRPLPWMSVSVVHSYRSRVCNVVKSWTVSMRLQQSSMQCVVDAHVAYVMVSRLAAFRLQGRVVYQMWHQVAVVVGASRWRAMILSLYGPPCCTQRSEVVRTCPNLSDTQKLNDAILQFVYGYSTRLNRLFADDWQWSLAS